MNGYSVPEVAGMLGLSEGQVRSYARFIAADRGGRGERRFSFQDLVLLRAAKGLVLARIPAAKVRRALARLREQLPVGRPLTAVRIAADGRSVVVRDGETVWNPESGQVLFDFAVSDLASVAAPAARRAVEAARRREETLTADDWYDMGCELESTLPSDARDAYRRAVELDPLHADAHVNLGRLLHEAGDLPAAEKHYRVALEADAGSATAAFNLGVVLEDAGRLPEAESAYERAIAADPESADAHYNLAQLSERRGLTAAAIRHLKAYRKLVLGR